VTRTLLGVDLMQTDGELTNCSGVDDQSQSVSLTLKGFFFLNSLSDFILTEYFLILRGF